MKKNTTFTICLLDQSKDFYFQKMVSFSFLLLTFVLLFLQYLTVTKSTIAMQNEIASDIIRFHVVANSDSEKDQVLKLQIKDALTKSLESTLKTAKNVEEAKILLQNNLQYMEELSNTIIRNNGFDYQATASIERGYFPLKVYGDLSLPPGEYEAVRIELGMAEGQNWWCIMFPPLCFVDATYNIVPDSSKKQLKDLLTTEEYNALFTEKKIDVKIKSKLIEWIKEHF